VILDFGAFDAWYEEDERNLGHPRDPFHRIEIVRSSRHVRVERDGEVLAESTAPYMLLEAPLPPRFYLPPEDVRPGALRPSPTRTFCAYKGEAAYLSADGADDVAWTYPAPLREAAGRGDRPHLVLQRARRHRRRWRAAGAGGHALVAALRR
jgi:uncharacterized protein (DUF427 family)